MKILEVLGIQSRPEPNRMYVSLNVMQARHTRFSHRSTKVILRVSIWTCIVLLFLFLVVYTILLAYVDKKLHPDSLSPQHTWKKIKLQRRKGLVNGLIENAHAVNGFNTSHRKTVWDISAFYSRQVTLPQCKWNSLFRILITSAPDYRERRNAIRNTWCMPSVFGKEDHSYHCIFLIGVSSNQSLNLEIQKEKRIHNDILIGNYLDSYRNLTLKVVHGFNWSVTCCPSSFVIKTDDDCFVNGGLLYDFLLYHNVHTANLYAGSVILQKKKLQVIRGENKKWSVSMQDYPEKYYPPYASGIGYVLSKDMAIRLINESAYIKPIVNEDAYIGIVVSRIRVPPVRSSRFTLSSSGLNVCNFLYVFIVHDIKPEKHKVMLDMSLRSQRECRHHQVVTTWD